MADYKNYFTFSSSVHNLLFKDLSVSSEGAMFGLCVGVAAFTFLYEGVKSLRHYLVILLLNYRDDLDTSLSEFSNRSPRKSLLGWIDQLPRRTFRRLKFHCLQTLLHMLQLTMGYMVMLMVMSYNAWLILTVVITTALCYYFHEYVLSRKPNIIPIETNASNL